MSNQNRGVGILGVGSALPETVMTNFDLEKVVDTSDEWIKRRTGISERRVLDKDTPAYELGVKAAVRAVEDAGITAEDLDLIIVTTNSPDYLVPSTACIIQGKIGAGKAAAFDMNAACTGFVYGITVAKQFIETGAYKYVMVVGCEALSKITDWEDRNTCVLFADAAGAVVLGPVKEGYGILGTNIGADGSAGHTITSPCCHIDPVDIEKRPHENKRVVWMDGSAVLKFAVRIMEQATRAVLEEAKMSTDDVDFIFPHQANIRIIEGAVDRLGIPLDKVPLIIGKYGNISSASIPVALDEAVKTNKLKKGDNLIFVGFGGGLTWGSALVKWCK